MEEFNLQILQKEATDWQKKNFGDALPYHPLLGVVEEVGELTHAHLKSEQGIRTFEDHYAKKIDAIGDIVIFLAHYCSLSGIDFHHAVLDTWQVVKSRDWRKYPTDGRTK